MFHDDHQVSGYHCIPQSCKLMIRGFTMIIKLLVIIIVSLNLANSSEEKQFSISTLDELKSLVAAGEGSNLDSFIDRNATVWVQPSKYSYNCSRLPSDRCVSDYLMLYFFDFIGHIRGNESNAEVVVIDGLHTRKAIYFAGTGEAEGMFSNLVLANGLAVAGSLLSVQNANSVTLVLCIFLSSMAVGSNGGIGGGAVWVSSKGANSVIMWGCAFSNLEHEVLDIHSQQSQLPVMVNACGANMTSISGDLLRTRGFIETGEAEEARSYCCQKDGEGASGAFLDFCLDVINKNTSKVDVWLDSGGGRVQPGMRFVLFVLMIWGVL